MIHHYIGCHFVIGNDTYILDGETVDDWNENWKLLLRPLLSITPEEALELCRYVEPDTYGGYRYVKWECTLHPNNDRLWAIMEVRNKNAEKWFEIDLIDGEVVVYGQERTDDGRRPLANQSYQQWYFHKGFAVPMYPSGKTLIELGMAIDSTKIKKE